MTRRDNKNRVNMWVAIGAVILIVLLIVWLTIADLWGDTDVAASVLPYLGSVKPLMMLLP